MTENLIPKSLEKNMEGWKREAESWKPRPYQERGLKFMLEDAHCGLLLDPGMGKTSISFAASKILLQKKLVNRVLVIAPKRAVYNVWPAELCAWKEFHELGIAILHGGKKDSVLRQLGKEHNIVLMNPEGADWLFGDSARVAALGADMLVVDESSKWKNSNSVRFKRLRPHLAKFKRRYILTGSPRPKNYLDLFGQVYILDRGAALGSYITHYRNNFFYPTGYQLREWAPLPDSPDKINALVAPMVLRMDAVDHLKLPKVLERLHRVELPAKVRTEYDRIEDTLMSTLFSAPLTNSAGARSKCCQIANGSVYTDSNPEERWASATRPVKVLHKEKVDELVDLYEELQGEPMLVSIGYHHDVEAIRNALGKDVPCINSNTTSKQAADYIERWNKGLLPVMMGHPASMGHALNLQKFSSRHVVFFDIPDDYDYYDQVFRRVWRQGNKAGFVMRHHIVAVGTVDEAKMRNLANKGSGQRAFLEAMKWYEAQRKKVRV